MTTPTVRPAPGARRRLVFRLALELCAGLVADFLLVRVWGPDLINRHQDWALVGALFCFALAIAVTFWLVLRIRRLWRALSHRNLRITPCDPDMES